MTIRLYSVTIKALQAERESDAAQQLSPSYVRGSPGLFIHSAVSALFS